MTKELLRWEDSPGLEHHCPKCQTPLNNPRAKHTCYFKHVEICPMFHQHFFMIGQAHNCDTCRRNNNAHDERHRQLALLLRQLSQLQEDQGLEPISFPSSPFTPTRSNSKRNAFSFTTDEAPEPTPKLKKRERKKAKKRIKALKGGDALTTSQIAAVRCALHPSSRNNSDTSTSSSSTTNIDEDDRGADSSTTPTSPTWPCTPTSPTNPSLTTLMNANKAFHPDVNGKLNSSRMVLQTSLLQILDTTYPSLETSVSNALLALNIPVVSSDKTPKCIVEIMEKIKEAVREDLFCTDCELRKFHLREAGWYRFVNRSVLALREE